jgi:antitoxin YefM
MKTVAIKETEQQSERSEKSSVLSRDEFNSWQEPLYVRSNPTNAGHLRQSIQEAQIGKTVERERIE